MAAAGEARWRAAGASRPSTRRRVLTAHNKGRAEPGPGPEPAAEPGAPLNSPFCLLENAIQAFGNGSDVKTGAGPPGTSPPVTDRQNPPLPTGTTGGMVEPEQNTARAQIPAQVRAEGGHRDDLGGLFYRTGRPRRVGLKWVGPGWVGPRWVWPHVGGA